MVAKVAHRIKSELLRNGSSSNRLSVTGAWRLAGELVVFGSDPGHQRPAGSEVEAAAVAGPGETVALCFREPRFSEDR